MWAGQWLALRTRCRDLWRVPGYGNRALETWAWNPRSRHSYR